MNAHKRSIAQNTTFLTAAYIFQKLCAFLYFTVLARFIGAADVGKYSFAISFTTIFGILIDMGLSSVLIREAAKRHEDGERYLNAIISMKLLFALVAYMIMSIAIIATNKEPLVIVMTLLSGIAMVLDSFTLSFWAAFRAHQNLQYESVSIGINQLLIVAVGLAGVIFKLPLYVLILALVAGSLFSFIYSSVLVRKHLHYRFSLVKDYVLMRMLILIAIPFALAGIFTRVFGYIDHVLLSLIAGDKEVGWYSVAYKITFAFQFIPAAVAASLFPAMSHHFAHAKEKLPQLFERSMFVLFLMAAPVVVGVSVLAQRLVTTIYTSEYMSSILPLQIMIGTIIFIFISYPVGALLNACNRQTTNTVNMGITMVANVILNLVLIPRYRQVGAAIATIISWALLFVLNMAFVRSIIKYNGAYILKKFTGIALSALIMGFVVYELQGRVPLIAAIVVGCIMYPLGLYLFRSVTAQELKHLLDGMLNRYEEDALTDN